MARCRIPSCKAEVASLEQIPPSNKSRRHAELLESQGGHAAYDLDLI